MAASAVPKLMAVVVLPTPPFWLARARTRGPDIEDFGGRSDMATSIGKDQAGAESTSRTTRIAALGSVTLGTER